MKNKSEQVRESLEELQALEEQYRGTTNELRIQMLRRIKQNTLSTFAGFAREVGCSVPTVNRWWKCYCEKGLNALLRMRATKRTNASDAKVMKELQRKIESGVFTSRSDVRRWLDTQEKTVDAQAPNDESASPATRMEATSQTDSLKHIVECLKNLPLEGEANQWGKAFITTLYPVLPDVDRILISFNLEYKLLDPENYNPERYTTQTLLDDLPLEDDVLVRSDMKESEGDDMLSRTRQAKFPFDHYHEPSIFQYYLKDAYLGSILLLHERSKSPTISEETLEQLEELRRLIEFALLYCIMRHQLAHPEGHIFNKRLGEIINEYGLSKAEVLTLRFLGRRYENIALSMRIDEKTVSTHMSSIYKKTGVDHILELFAKYFTPLITPTKKS